VFFGVTFTGISYTEQFSDLECTQSLPVLQENMVCENIVGRTASFRGFCNAEPSVLPLPSTEFVTQRYRSFSLDLYAEAILSSASCHFFVC
jgi:hypothetical protein